MVDLQVFGALDGRLNDGLEGAPDGELDGGLDGALDGGLDGGLDGTLDDGLDGALDGELDGGLDGGFGGTFDCALNGGLDGSLGDLMVVLMVHLILHLQGSNLTLFSDGACRVRRLKNLGARPKIPVPGYISGLALNRFWPVPAGHRA